MQAAAMWNASCRAQAAQWYLRVQDAEAAEVVLAEIAAVHALHNCKPLLRAVHAKHVLPCRWSPAHVQSAYRRGH